MATGTNADPNFLWKLRAKINTPDGGLNWMLHLANKTQAQALAAAVKIMAHYRAILPSTCEVKHCTISKSNTNKDSKIVMAAIGDGLYLQSGVDPAATTYNRFDDCLKVRFEDEAGWGVTEKIGPIPDTIIGNGEIILPIASVTDMTAADPAAPTQPVTYATAFQGLMLLIGKNCSRVKSSTNIAGGNYDYFAFEAAHVIGVGKKKGGRISVS